MENDIAQKKAIVLLSGGIDSATCAAIAQEQGFAVYALSFSYGQRHSCELSAAQKIATHLAVTDHKTLTIDLKTIGGSSLTTDMKVPKNNPDTIQKENEIPNTYVPARNTIFLSCALGWAEVVGSADIFIGVNAVDYSGYPDCRPAFIEAFEHMANLATKTGIQNHPITIQAPLSTLTKSDIIRKGIACGVDFSLTHSCYDPSADGLACGGCDSCLIRKKGFVDAGVTDPTRYCNTDTI